MRWHAGGPSRGLMIDGGRWFALVGALALVDGIASQIEEVGQ